MRGLILYFFFIGLNAVFSYILTGSLWLSALLFVVFGVISAFGFNYCRLMHLSAVFLIATIAVSVLFSTIKPWYYFKNNNCSVNHEASENKTTIECNNIIYTLDNFFAEVKR